MKNYLLFVFFFLVSLHGISQKKALHQALPYSSALKLNLSSIVADFKNMSIRLAVEQKLLTKTTLQVEIGKMLNGAGVTINPQIRYYTNLSKQAPVFIGLGYLYKENAYGVSDSVRLSGTGPYYAKSFSISKYINAFTVNGGFLFYWHIAKKTDILTEFTGGLGIRIKKSHRYGLGSDEEIDLREAFMIRPQYYEDTKGQKKNYLEPSAIFRIILPLLVR